jgi:phosphoribosylamine--glycine ligase
VHPWPGRPGQKGTALNVLIIGSGGREHALAWRIAQSPLVTHLYCAPGNPGMAQLGTCLPPAGISYLSLADQVDADLTIVGPEVPLVCGLVDEFRIAGRLIIGPTAQAARLEGSKIFAKRFFARHAIPTARFEAVDNRDDALRALRRFNYPVVLKADGLMAGKGVIIVHDETEAQRAIDTLGDRLVIEEFLEGEEASFIVLSDGRTVIPMEPSQDHKRAFDADQGPNTGGMGAYSDSLILNPQQTREVMERIILPTVEATRFTGFLYAGLMLTPDGPKLLEYNVRMGDPEAQPLMHRLKTDLLPVLLAAARGELAGTTLEWNPEPSVCVVAASGGYPGSYPVGIPISGIDEAEAAGATVFHAGTRLGPRGLETAGGRVLGVTASGRDLADAIDRTYSALRKIHFDRMHYRTDIGRKGLTRYNK